MGFKKGNIPWNKGLTKETDERVRKQGGIPWNKGLVGVYSEETIEKMSEAHKGTYPSEETKGRMSESQRGKPVSEETREKLRNIRLGTKQTEETKNKISESLRKNPTVGQQFKGKILTEKEKKRLLLTHILEKEFKNKLILEGNLVFHPTSVCDWITIDGEELKFIEIKTNKNSPLAKNQRIFKKFIDNLKIDNIKYELRYGDEIE